MHYRQLGSTDIRVSEIGFGAWGIGGNKGGAKAYGVTDDNKSRQALQVAFDRGVTFYDTSPLYGFGHSECLIGETFAQQRDQVVISSKVGYLNYTGDQDFSPEHINRSLDASLRRLRTDYIDVFQLHDPPVVLLRNNDAVFRALDELKKAGKIRAVGISLRSPADCLEAVGLFPFQCIQVNFNLVDQRVVDEGILDICRENGIGVICRTPLCFGFLTGKYSVSDKYDDSDHRSGWSVAQIERWANAYHLFANCLNATVQQTNAQIALRYCLSFMAISTTIPGILTKDHVEENVHSSCLGPFDREVLEQFRNIYRNHTFFVKKS